jgi:cyclomaltodextrinase
MISSIGVVLRRLTLPGRCTLVLAIACCELLACAAPQRERALPQTDAGRCSPPPTASTLFLRGTMANWALRDDFAFQYHCDAYVLNVHLTGSHEFKIFDERSSEAMTFGAPPGTVLTLLPNQPTAIVSAAAANGAGNLKAVFAGEQTIRLVFKSVGNQAANPTIRIGPRDFDDPTQVPVENPVARTLSFDSRALADKHPFGAVTEGNDVEFNLNSGVGVAAVTLLVERRRLEGPQELLEYGAPVRVPLTLQSHGERNRWHGTYRFEQIGVYGYYFEVQIDGKTYAYENNADTVYWTRELGSNGQGAVAVAGDASRIRRFRQTVYRADFHVPDWARDAVFYYIFPERFRNGDSGNDPRPGVDTYHDQAVELHRNWLEKPYLPRSGDGSDTVYGNDFFGGDLAGIVDKLDYIAGLGANTLYLTPIFRAASNHKYDTADYKNIDPHFGRNGDFARLTHAAARRGIRVILDTSLNHTGSDSIYFDRYAKYPGLGAFDGGKIQPDSAYASWYSFDPTQSNPDKQYRGWVGARDLPETNKASASFRDYAFAAPDSVMKQWLDRGAAGWRMDVAPWVPDDFWRDWRRAVKQHRPDALTIAETQFDASKFFLGDEFDSTMNYIFRNAVQDYADGAKASAIYRNIELMRENYPPQAFYALMNLLSTHDSARALFEFGYRDENTDEATKVLAKQRLRLAVLFQMIFPGAPAVLYGDEVGVTGGEDPYNRVTYPWPDRGGKPDTALLADYKALIKLRKDNAVLRHGSLDAPAYIDDHVIVLIRRDGARVAVTATNNDDVPRTVSVQLPADLKAAYLTDALSGKKIEVQNGGAKLMVPAMYGLVLLNRGT